MFFRRSNTLAESPRESVPGASASHNVLALRASGTTPASRIALAEALFHNGQLAEALDKLATALAENPELSQGQFLRGVALARAGKLQEALPPLQLAIELDETIRYAYVLLAAIRMKLERYDEALAAADALVSRDDAEAADFALRAEILRRAKRIDEAIESLRTAIEHDSQIPWLHEKMGQLLGERGDIAAALDALERAVRLAPTSSKAMLAAADLLAGVGRGAEAIKFYQRATFCGPPIGATYARLGHCCVEQGLLLDAVVWLRTAIVLDPKQAACYRDLAQIYTRQGRTDVAQRYLDSAARLAGAEST